MTSLVFAIATPEVGMMHVQARQVVKVNTVTLSKKNVMLIKGKQLQLKATVKSKGAIKKKIVWSSSNKKIAVVSSKGVVKAKGKGTAEITARIKGTKKKAVCKIKVKEPVKPASNAYIYESKWFMNDKGKIFSYLDFYSDGTVRDRCTGETFNVKDWI